MVIQSTPACILLLLLQTDVEERFSVIGLEADFYLVRNSYSWDNSGVAHFSVRDKDAG